MTWKICINCKNWLQLPTREGATLDKPSEMMAFSLSISGVGVFQLMPRVELTHFNVYLYAHPYLSVFSL